MQIFFVVIVLFLLSSNNSDLSLNMISPRFFYFSRSTKNFNPPSLDLRSLGGAIFKPKDIQQYLGFFFDKKLSFQYHTHYYANKTLFTIKSMKILGNLTRGLSPVHKCLLFCICIFSIMFIVSSSGISKKFHYTIFSKI